MKHCLRLCSAALLLGALPFVTVSCGKKRNSAAGSVDASSTAADSTWGFAARLPKDTEAFVSVYRLGDLVTGLKNSGFAKKLLSIPAVSNQISMAQIEAAWNSDPDVSLFASLFQTEVTVAVSEGFTENVIKLTKLLRPVPRGFKEAADFNKAERQKQGGPTMGKNALDEAMEQYRKPEVIAEVLEILAETDFPPVLVAVHAGNNRAAISEKIKSATTALPPELAKLSTSGSFKLDDKYEFQTLTLSFSKTLKPGESEQLKALLAQRVNDPARAASLTDKLVAKTIELSWGWVDDTLVAAIGKDHSHVKLASAGDSVLSLPEISRRTEAWREKKPISLSYSSRGTNKSLTELTRSIPEAIFTLMQAGSDMSPVPLEGLAANLKKLAARAGELWPVKVTAFLSAAWWDGGLHAESFGGAVEENYDSSKPLTYGSLAGPKTVLLLESRVRDAARDKAAAFVEEAAGTLWNSYLTSIKPALPTDVQSKVSMVEVALPMIKDTWKNLNVLRSALGSESALLVNLDGTMPPSPSIPDSLKGLPFPRLLAVSDLKDRSRLSEAWNGLSTTVEMLTSFSGMKGKPGLEKKEGELTFWGLPLPEGDSWPHTAVSGARFYAGSHLAFTREAAAKSLTSSGPPSGAHVHVNLKPVWDFSLTAISASPETGDHKQSVLDTITALRAFHEIDVRISEENGDARVQAFIGIKDLP